MRNPPPDPYRERLELLRRLAWLEAQKAQRSANRLTLLTNHLDLLLRELGAAAGECDHAESSEPHPNRNRSATG